MNDRVVLVVGSDDGLRTLLEEARHGSEAVRVCEGLSSVPRSALCVVSTDSLHPTDWPRPLPHFVLATGTDDARLDEALERGAAGVVRLPAPASRLRAELARMERLRRDEHFAHALRIALDHVSESVEVTDPEGRIEYVNAAFTANTGYSREKVYGRTPAEVLRSDAHDTRFYDVMWAHINRGETWHGELIGRHESGAFLRQITTLAPLVSNGEVRHHVAIKEPLGRMGFAGDISEASEALGPEVDFERARHVIGRLRRSEERYRAMLGAAGDGVLLADLETASLVDANPAACDIFGYSTDELRMLTVALLSAPGEEAKLAGISADIRDRGRASSHDLRMQRKDGSVFWAALRFQAFELERQTLYVCTVRDVSGRVQREEELARSNEELRGAQERLRRTERLAALGQLAASVGHEINNPLQFLESSLEAVANELAEARDPNPELLEELISEAREGADRIRTITRDLAPFARVDNGKTSLVDLQAVVRRTCRMVGPEVRHRATLVMELGDTDPVKGSEGKLAQLVTNLLVNAAHAIEEGNSLHNTVTVRTVMEHGQVALSVCDTGVGMTEAVMARALEPFFTTKSSGQGTGLGLALCAETVRIHGGGIEIESTLGQGTCVCVSLPAQAEPLSGSPPERSRADLGRTLRVLIVDDEPLVLRACRRLVGRDHDVVLTESGAEALEYLRDGREFDVVLCDVMMPSMDGPTLYHAIEEEFAELIPRIVFCSGGAFTDRAREFLKSIPNPTLLKPVRRAELVEAILQVIDERPEAM